MHVVWSAYLAAKLHASESKGTLGSAGLTGYPFGPERKPAEGSR